MGAVIVDHVKRCIGCSSFRDALSPELQVLQEVKGTKIFCPTRVLAECAAPARICRFFTMNIWVR